MLLRQLRNGAAHLGGTARFITSRFDDDNAVGAASAKLVGIVLRAFAPHKRADLLATSIGKRARGGDHLIGDTAKLTVACLYANPNTGHEDDLPLVDR